MDKIFFYAGGYAKPGEGGICRYSLDPETGDCTLLSECVLLENPSYLLRHPQKDVLYAVEELQPEGNVVALSVNDGELQKLCSFPTGGADPCHLSLSPEGQFLFVSNYTSGSLAVFRLDNDGVPVGRSDFVQHTMTAREKEGANPARQGSAHVHFALCDGVRVFVNDLGLDKVFVYDWDAAQGRLTGCSEQIEFPKGSGPRHLEISEDGQYLYVFCELSVEIHVFEKDGEKWRRIQVVSAVPEEYRPSAGFSNLPHGEDLSTGAAIRIVSDDKLIVSTRGHDSFAVFRISEDGQLYGRQLFSAAGKVPRDFQVLGAFLIVANQESGSLAVFRRNDPTDRYDLVGHVPHGGSPSCICPIPGNR